MLAAAALCLQHGASGATDNTASWPEGVAFHSCAPYDGAAMEVQVPLPQQAIKPGATGLDAVPKPPARTVIIRVNEQLTAASFTRRITGIGKPGGASVTLCGTKDKEPSAIPGHPGVSYPSCKDASSGVVTIHGLRNEFVSGHLNVGMPTGPLSGPFRAKLIRNTKPVVCG